MNLGKRFHIARMFGYSGEYRKYAILTPLLVLVECFFDILIPYLMAMMIDVGIVRGDVDYVVRIGLLMILFAVISMIFGTIAARTAVVGSSGFAMNIRRLIFGKIEDFAFRNTERFGTASLITRLTTDISFVQQMYQMVTRLFVRAPAMALFATVMAVRINRTLSFVFFISIPLLLFAIVFMIRKAHPRFISYLDKMDSMNANVQENLIAIRVVKAFVRERHEKEKFEITSKEVRAAQVLAEKVVIWGMPMMMFMMNASIVAILWFGGKLIVGGGMLPGELFSFLTYSQQIMIALMMISMVFAMYVISQASVRRILDVIDEPLSMTDEAGDPELKVPDGSIEFRNVNFSYAADAEKLTLKNINVRIESGETIGIIGGTGSGKSTFVQLIPRLYDVLSGEVLVGGHDVRSYKFRELRDSVAIVLQKNVLFSGTIESNLRWGDPDATQSEIELAAKTAQAHDFILSFPEGYQTDLGQGGVNVSGGQKQRISIARTLLKKPKIIILDDSTSAIDVATEAKFRRAFRENYADTTNLVIAQRVSSVMNADRILVIDEGKIVAFGKHAELMESCAIYRETYESQQKGVVGE